MPETLISLLRENVLPAAEALAPDRLVLAHEAGKKSLGAYVPGEAPRRAPDAEDGEDLPGMLYPYQGHATLEIVFAVQGRAELALAGRRYALGDGDAGIITPHTPHLERIRNRNQGYHLLWLRVAPDHLSIHSSSYSKGTRFQLVRGASIPRSGAIGRCFEAAAEESSTRGAHWFPIVKARITEGLALAIRHFDAHGLGRNPDQSRQGSVDVAKAFIQSHFSEGLSLEKIAGEVFLSPNYFSSLFTQTAGKTVIEYLNEVRIDEARRLLAETDLPVRMVAKRVGIPAPSYFCRLFRRVVGQTAKDFRLCARKR